MSNIDVRIGDVGTVYHLPTYDADLDPTNFNPTTATVKQLIFKMPGTAALITRDAVAAQRTIDSVAVWGLQYTVTAADVAPWSDASTGGFHQADGAVEIEGYVEFSGSQKWSSSTVSRDQKRRLLQVKARLSA